MSDLDHYDLPKIRLNMPSSTGTWLNGCQTPQHRYVSLEIRTGGKSKEGGHKHILDLGMSIEQFAHMLTSTMETTCTLFHYCDEGPLKTDEVIRPQSIKARMQERLGEVHSTTMSRLDELYKDVHEMVNGKKPGKKDLADLLHQIRILRDNQKSNEGFVVHQAVEEVEDALSNARTQLAQLMPSVLPEEAIKEIARQMIPEQELDQKLLPPPDTGVEPSVTPVERKERTVKPIEELTAMELAEELSKELSRMEWMQPKSGGHSTLYHAHAWSTMPNRVRIQYVSYQSDSLLDLNEARAYLRFLREVKVFEDMKHHFHYITALKRAGDLPD